jgi:hypothetical protein
MKILSAKMLLAIAAVTLFGAVQPAQATYIKMETKVQGINAWVLVRYGAWPKYGGRVVWDNAAGCYVTDDVARGETLRITISPMPGEYPVAFYDVMSYGAHHYLSPLRLIDLPFSETITIPMDPAYDSNYIETDWTVEFTARIPIGPRVR